MLDGACRNCYLGKSCRGGNVRRRVLPHTLPEPQSRKRAAELLEIVALEPSKFLKRYPCELSGGQQQRVGVARALAADPPVMLMDEPFGAIDPINREVIQDEFMRIQRQVNKTVLFVSHDIDEAVKMADCVSFWTSRLTLVISMSPAWIVLRMCLLEKKHCFLLLCESNNRRQRFDAPANPTCSIKIPTGAVGDGEILLSWQLLKNVVGANAVMLLRRYVSLCICLSS